MSYITKEDLRAYEDLVINFTDAALDAWVAEADAVMLSIARQKGVFDPDDIGDPLDHTVKETLIFWALASALRSKIGTDSVGTVDSGDEDVYYLKSKIYAKSYSTNVSLISTEMVMNEVTDSSQERVISRRLLRA